MDLVELVKFLGVSAGPMILGALIIRVMWNVDEILKPNSRAPLGARSRSFWFQELSRFDLFRQLFDNVYNTRAFCRPSVRRFVSVGPATILLALVFCWLRMPGITLHNDDELNILGESNSALYMIAIGAMAGIVLVLINIVFDYFSIWQSRIWISALGRSAAASPIVLVADLAFSLAIFVFAWEFSVPASTFILGFTMGLLDIIFKNQPGLFLMNLGDAMSSATSHVIDVYADIRLGYDASLKGALEQVFAELAGLPRSPDAVNNFKADSTGVVKLAFATSVVSTMVTSLWLWLYAIGLVVGGLLQSVLGPLRSVSEHLDFEAYPLRLNGLFMGLALIAFGAVGAFLNPNV